MLHETHLLDPATTGARVNALNHRYRHHAAVSVLEHALRDPELGRVALVSSFGAESVVLLHMLSVMAPDTPVIFIDTQMLFPETLDYQRELAGKLDLRDLRVIRAAPSALAVGDPDDTLHQRNTDACCQLRKTVPLEQALRGFDGWITGRKRFQGGSRASLDFFEDEGGFRIKVNPLAHWDRQDVADYILNNRLPRHPLVAKGYPSIGCAPCTSPVSEGSDPRAGRWPGQDKDECGIHFIDGKAVRIGKTLEPVAQAPAETSSKDAPAPRASDAQLGDEGGHAMSEPVIVTDTGFAPDDWQDGFCDAEALTGSPQTLRPALDLPGNADPAGLEADLPRIAMIRIRFEEFSDGRGFTLGQRLRRMGYAGRLRAAGNLLPDQYALARRCGFDEVEIDADRASRQPEAHWIRAAAWGSHDYRSRLRAG